MKLPSVITRVKDSPAASSARATADGSRSWCVSGGLASGSGITSLIEVTAAAAKTYWVKCDVQYYDNAGAVPAGTDVDIALRATSDITSSVFTFSWVSNDARTGAAADRAPITVASVHSWAAAGEHEFSASIADGGYGANAFYSLTVIETGYTGDSCFSAPIFL